MTTIDLSRPLPPPTSLLDALPRRVALTLPELQLVAEHAGGAPLPFDVGSPGDGTDTAGLEGRLGASRGTSEDHAYRAAVSALHDPATSLARRGLEVDGTFDEGLVGAVGLLATPQVALDIDVAVEGAHAKAWHRQADDAVATLATTDGIVFEIAWFPVTAWPSELARVGVIPEDLDRRESAVPAYVDLPYELVDAAVEAASSGRSDLVQVLTNQHSGAVLDADGRAFADVDVTRLLHALGHESQGRLRVLVAEVARTASIVVGVRSWVLVADGWRTLHPHESDGTRVAIRAIGAAELGADLAPVLSEVMA